MVIVNNANVARVHVVRVYAAYYEITNENRREDHGEEDNMNAYEWVYDTFPDFDLFIPERSTNPDFDACWTEGAYDTQENANEEQLVMMDQLSYYVPPHIRAYHVCIEPCDIHMQPVLAQDIQNNNIQNNNQDNIQDNNQDNIQNNIQDNIQDNIQNNIQDNPQVNNQDDDIMEDLGIFFEQEDIQDNNQLNNPLNPRL